MGVEGDGGDRVEPVHAVLELRLGLGLHEGAEHDERGDLGRPRRFVRLQDPVDEEVAVAAAARRDQHERLLDAVGQAGLGQVPRRGPL